MALVLNFQYPVWVKSGRIQSDQVDERFWQMTIIQFILAFISAFGLGAIVQTYISQRADTKKRNFQEKKEVYVGILDAFRSVSVSHSVETAKNVGYWHMRCNLVGSNEVCALLEEIIEGDRTTQPEKIKKLQVSMRKDLNVTTD